MAAESAANINICMIKIGNIHVYTRIITQEMVGQFAQITGDTNPLHLNPEFAKKSIFEEPIAHGMLTASLISAALFNYLGDGAIYLSQTIKFLKPVFIGSTVTIELIVLALDNKKVTLQTNCIVGGIIVLTGEAQGLLI